MEVQKVNARKISKMLANHVSKEMVKGIKEGRERSKLLNKNFIENEKEAETPTHCLMY